MSLLKNACIVKSALKAPLTLYIKEPSIILGLVDEKEDQNAEPARSCSQLKESFDSF